MTYANGCNPLLSTELVNMTLQSTKGAWWGVVEEVTISIIVVIALAV